MRWPSSRLLDASFRPSFLPTCALKKPRTLCGCQPVALLRSASVAPYLRRSSLMIVAPLPLVAVFFPVTFFVLLLDVFAMFPPK